MQDIFKRSILCYSKTEDLDRQKEDTQDSDDEGASFSSTQHTSTTSQIASSTDNPSTSAAPDEKKKERVPAYRKKFEWSDKIRCCHLMCY